MGLFDSVIGKKGKSEDIVLEPYVGGYLLKNYRPRTPNIDKVCIFFNAPASFEGEPEVIKDILKKHGVPDRLVEGTLIMTAYEVMPDIDEYVSKNEMPESLNAFIMARAMMKGLARSQAEMGRLAVYPFDVKGVKGVLVLKEA